MVVVVLTAVVATSFEVVVIAAFVFIFECFLHPSFR